jgi:hypothetical protein
MLTVAEQLLLPVQDSEPEWLNFRLMRHAPPPRCFVEPSQPSCRKRLTILRNWKFCLYFKALNPKS